METYFTSDTHYGHANIIKYSNRPFSDVGEMDRAMMQNWNDRVQPEDEVYHLGDFGFLQEYQLQRILDRLNGRKHLIRGNHDKNAVRLRGWEWVKDYHELRIGGDRVVLCHYGMRVWNGSHRGTLMLYGHSHGTLPGDTRSLDVGVDCWDYHPVTLAEIKRRLAQNPERVLPDYHGKDRE